MGEHSGPANVLGKYKLIAELGRGGMAEVFLALVQGPAGFNKLMVIKRLRPHLAEEHEFLQMFLDEARLAAKLSHPNIVQTMEVGEHHGQFYISMEYLEGQPLNRILRRCDEVTPTMVVRILADALKGLHAAHELTDYDGSALGVVHRDATPHNIFVTYNGQVKVVDFGIAKAAISVAETRTGVLKGKVSYMAPEQARGDAVDRRADIFSIGCCLWEGLAGRRLWKGKSDIQVLNAIMGEEAIPSPRVHMPDLDPALEAIVMKALAFDPDDRYQTAKALREALTSYLDGIGDRTSPLDASRLVANHFSSEREKLRGLIEAQTRQAASMSTGAYQHLDLPRVAGTPQSLASPTPSHGSDRISSLPPNDRDTPTTVHPSSPSGPSHPGLSHSSQPPYGTPFNAATAVPTSPDAGRRTPLLLAGAAFLLAAVVAGVAFVSSGADEQPAAPATKTEKKPEAAPKEATQEATQEAKVDEKTVEDPDPTSGEVEVTIEAKPKGASIYIDDKKVGTSPYTGTFPRDEEVHALTIKAPGYNELKRELRLDKSRVLDLRLAAARTPYRAPTPTPPPPKAAPAPPPPPPPPAPKEEPPSSLLGPRKGPKDARPIDGDNPYQKNK